MCVLWMQKYPRIPELPFGFRGIGRADTWLYEVNLLLSHRGRFHEVGSIARDRGMAGVGAACEEVGALQNASSRILGVGVGGRGIRRATDEDLDFMFGSIAAPCSSGNEAPSRV